MILSLIQENGTVEELPSWNNEEAYPIDSKYEVSVEEDEQGGKVYARRQRHRWRHERSRRNKKRDKMIIPFNPTLDSLPDSKVYKVPCFNESSLVFHAVRFDFSSQFFTSETDLAEEGSFFARVAQSVGKVAVGNSGK